MHVIASFLASAFLHILYNNTMKNQNSLKSLLYELQVSHYAFCIQLQYIQYWLSPWFCGRLFFGAWKFPSQN